MADVVTMPKLGFDMAEGTLVRWAKAEGEEVEKGELLAEIETDKATVEVESLFTGTVRKHLVSEGSIVPVNTPIAVIGGADEEIDFAALGAEEGEASAPKESAPAEAPAEEAPEAAQPEPATAAPAEETDAHLPGGVRATPLARRIAEDKNIDLTTLSGTGPGGRIVKADVEAAEAAPPAAAPAPAPAAQPAEKPVAPAGPALAPLAAATTLTGPDCAFLQTTP